MTWFDGVLIFAGVLGGAYVVVAGFVTVYQRRLIYRPDRRRTTPAASGLRGVSIAELQTDDGERLIAWHAPAAHGYPTVLYFHGNAGYIELRADRMADLMRRGFGVVMPSYRGFGGSSGKPSEFNNDLDARLVYDWLRDQGVAAHDIIPFGESLGTGVATKLAVAKNCSALVLDSPYTSMVELGREAYPWLPVRRLMWDPYETVRHIRRVTVPVLVLHGEHDARVPVHMGRAVWEAAVAPKQIITYPGAGHLDHRRFGSFDDFDRWVRELPGRGLMSARQIVVS